jgi:hypothetical protein
MGWTIGPVYHGPGDSEWWIGGWQFELGGVAVVAEAFTDLTMVTTLYMGNRQPNYALAQIHGEPYKDYFIGVRGGGNFWIQGVGGEGTLMKLAIHCNHDGTILGLAVCQAYKNGECRSPSR